MKGVIFPLPKPNILLLVRAGIAVAISEEVDAGAWVTGDLKPRS